LEDPKQSRYTERDREAMRDMANEGGTSGLVSDDEQDLRGSEGGRDPSPQSPLIAIFADQTSADNALARLRGMGIPNENIAVASSDSVIHSPANDTGTYRATGEGQNGFEFKDDLLPDSFRAAAPLVIHASPNSVGYDEDFEARQYQHPLHQVMVSVEVSPGQREAVYELLVRAGAAS
jgi:hypothetical protein